MSERFALCPPLPGAVVTWFVTCPRISPDVIAAVSLPSPPSRPEQYLGYVLARFPSSQPLNWAISDLIPILGFAMLGTTGPRTDHHRVMEPLICVDA